MRRGQFPVARSFFTNAQNGFSFRLSHTFCVAALKAAWSALVTLTDAIFSYSATIPMYAASVMRRSVKRRRLKPEARDAGLQRAGKLDQMLHGTRHGIYRRRVFLGHLRNGFDVAREVD